MIDVDNVTPESELAALEQLVACEGWEIYQRHITTAWGDAACLDQIDKALTGAHVDDELAITKRIRDTFKGIRAEATWVEKRIAELKSAIKRKPTPVVDAFARFRRVPR